MKYLPGLTTVAALPSAFGSRSALAPEVGKVRKVACVKGAKRKPNKEILKTEIDKLYPAEVIEQAMRSIRAKIDGAMSMGNLKKFADECEALKNSAPSLCEMSKPKKAVGKVKAMSFEKEYLLEHQQTRYWDDRAMPAPKQWAKGDPINNIEDYAASLYLKHSEEAKNRAADNSRDYAEYLRRLDEKYPKHYRNFGI